MGYFIAGAIVMLVGVIIGGAMAVTAYAKKED